MARSSAAPLVVELYTSEGCSSCPPADRWLSTLKGRGDVVALSFHVSYWDQLGWRDPFASAVFTERQRRLMASSGSRYVYTPQVTVNGADWRRWPELPPVRAATSAPSLTLQRDGNTVVASVGPSTGILSGYWALVEDGLASHVRAGENAGETLRHDHVVRRYEPLAPWKAQATHELRWDLGPTPVRGRVILVLTDDATQRPVQALALAC